MCKINIFSKLTCDWDPFTIKGLYLWWESKRWPEGVIPRVVRALSSPFRTKTLAGEGRVSMQSVYRVVR